MNANVEQRLLKDPRLVALWVAGQQHFIDAESKRAKADPLAHKLTRVMEDGKPPSYRYWRGELTNGKGQRVRFCWTVHRNAAGFYLGFRETWRKNGNTVRDQFVSRRVKARCIDIAKQRYAAMAGKGGA